MSLSPIDCWHGLRERSRIQEPMVRVYVSAERAVLCTRMADGREARELWPRMALR
jgi:hypothetical protein